MKKLSLILVTLAITMLASVPVFAGPLARRLRRARGVYRRMPQIRNRGLRLDGLLPREPRLHDLSAARRHDQKARMAKRRQIGDHRRGRHQGLFLKPGAAGSK